MVLLNEIANISLVVFCHLIAVDSDIVQHFMDVWVVLYFIDIAWRVEYNFCCCDYRIYKKKIITDNNSDYMFADWAMVVF
jgi:hypothetical protein